jgi:flagellar motor protein MotB
MTVQPDGTRAHVAAGDPLSSQTLLSTDSPLAELQLHEVHALLQQGRLEDAERLLLSVTKHNPTAAALDLLARVYVRDGRPGEARLAWESIVRSDPDNQSARAALLRLASPWRLAAVAQRLAFLALVAVSAFMCGVGLITMTLIVFRSDRLLSPQDAPFRVAVETALPRHPPTATDAVSTNLDVSTPDQSPAEPLTSIRNSEIPVSPRVAKSDVVPPMLPSIGIPECTVTADGRDMVVVFNEGLFRYRCELTDGGTAALVNLAAALSSCPPVETVLIEGHTDSDPMPPGGVFSSNYELGFARAATIAVWLKQHTGISSHMLVATSSGSGNPPFQDDTYESRLRNRTVVLRIRFEHEKGSVAP